MCPSSDLAAGMRRRAFTLVELLITISIISILMGLMLPALSGVRDTAYTVADMAAAQQINYAYLSSAEERRGKVIQGYAPLPPSGVRAWAKDDLGNNVIGVQHVMGRRYPWRLMPYMDYVYKGLYRMEGDLNDARFEDREMFQYLVSVAPRMGLNQAFMGGSHDSDFTGIVLRNPFAKQFVEQQVGSRWYIDKLSDSPAPSDQIVFASGYGVESSPGDDGLQGSFKVTPPSFINRMWVKSVNATRRSPSDVGNVRFNGRDLAVVALLDGHAEKFTFEQMEDMRHWAPLADTSDWLMPHP